MAPLLTLAFALVLTAAAAYAAWLLIVSGTIRGVKLQTTTLGPFLVLYKDHVGPYHKTSVHTKHLVDIVIDAGLRHTSDRWCVTLVGLFYDNPKHVPARACRSSIGYVFKSGAEIQKPEDLENYTKLLNALTLVKKGELKVGVFPASQCLAVRWPLVGIVSIMLAVLRVYPRLEQALAALPPAQAPAPFQGSLEVYEPATRSMWVAFPLSPQRSDLVPFAGPADAASAGKAKEQ